MASTSYCGPPTYNVPGPPGGSITTKPNIPICTGSGALRWQWYQNVPARDARHW